MKKILGLDLGTNSIGWAIRDVNATDQQIIDAGVLAFEKGVGDEKGVEVPLVKKRTVSRGKRRNYMAEKYRKWELLKCLIENEPRMCPLTIEELDGWRRYKKGIGRVYPQNNEFINWLKLDFNCDGKSDFDNPFHLRKVLAENKIDNPKIIGRALYHLTQKRGFMGRDEVESETIMKGSKDTGTVGVNSIHEIMEKQQTTLGSALYYDYKKNGNRIRKRYNLRTDIEAELKTICAVQDIPEESVLFKKLYKSIVWQRPLRSQKGNVGICTYERKDFIDGQTGRKYIDGKSRCPISHPLYEEFRAWSFINNIKFKMIGNDEVSFQSLSMEQREFIYHKLFFRKSKSQFDFNDIAKALDPKRNKYIFNYKDNFSISGCPISASIKEIFGEIDQIKLAYENDEPNKKKKGFYNYEDIWHVLFYFDSNEKLEEFAQRKLRLDDDDVKKFSKISLRQGYASLSKCAINKILPFLKKGYIYSDAVYLANLKKVINKRLTEEEENKIIEGIHAQMIFHKEEKLLLGIVNNLISKYMHLTPDQTTGRLPGYVLTSQDKKMVNDEIIDTIGFKTWNEKTDQEREKIVPRVQELYQSFLQTTTKVEKGLLFFKIPRFDEKIKLYLKTEWNAKVENLKYLYHPSETEIYPTPPQAEGKLFLGDPVPISRGFKNPMAMKTLYHLKRFINYLIEINKIDENTRIVVEIARELNDANKRKAISIYQNRREKQNAEFAKAIIGTIKNKYPSIDENDPAVIDKFRLWFEQIPENDNIIDQVASLKEDVQKWRLWLEQKGQCIYTGKVISCTELFDGTKFDFEHTIPADLSFDNELKNLSIADSKYNRQIKQKKIPSELPNYDKDMIIGGVTYTAIKPRLKYFEERVERYENQIEYWKKEAKKATTKERKDICIQKKHVNQFELDYWKKKLDTFTIAEYKSVWRNSQLRDTQIITKYALPYLKTIFNKVDVQKGIITSEFRKIYNLGFEKNRDSHTHHAVDAAVLTLIPSAVMRDKLLKEHFESLENNISFHTTPPDWKNFKPTCIKNVEHETLVNFIKQDRTLVSSKKYIRKRGRIQYLKEISSDGRVIFRLDKYGKKIPLIAKGDGIRGQLHEESFLGAIKEFDFDENGKTICQDGKTRLKKDMDGEDKISFVKRIPITELKSPEDCDKIVDRTLRKTIKNILIHRVELGKTFHEAVNQNIWMLDKNGNEKKNDKNGNLLLPIRHVRCYVAAGRGFLTKEKALEIKQHSMLSKHEHKQVVYAKNEEMIACLYYEDSTEKNILKSFKLVSIFELSQLGLKRLSDISSLPEYRNFEIGKKQNRKLIDLRWIITTGTRILIYLDHPDELKELSITELLRRLYIVYKFNEAPSAYIYLQHHKEARQDSELGKGSTKIDLSSYQPRLRMTAGNFNGLIEGLNFEITLDGKIAFK